MSDRLIRRSIPNCRSVLTKNAQHVRICNVQYIQGGPKSKSLVELSLNLIKTVNKAMFFH